MKRSTKRLVSLLICLIMVMAVLPAAALAAGTTTVYCQAPAGWSNCNAYWWGSSAENPGWPGVSMSQNSDGIWSYEVPSDASGLIFNDGSSQTADLTVPTDDKVMFVFENSYWTTYGKVEVVTEYFVAGSGALCGVEWNPGAAQNKMTENGDGTYSLTYTGVAAGSYELKVTTGSWATSWGEAGTTGNYMLTVENNDSTVVISFDPATELVSVVVNPVTEPEIPDGETLIAEGTDIYATDDDAWGAVPYAFIPAEDGTVTVNITACDPGFYLEVYKNGQLVEEHSDDAADLVNISVTAGIEYKFLLYPYSSADFEPVAGSVTFKITSDVAAGELAPEVPEDGIGSSEGNPQPVRKEDGFHIKPGQTMWFVYDNPIDTPNAKILHISSGTPYAVTYRGVEVPVDAEGFVSYEMVDADLQGKYVFSVTNNGSYEAYFSIMLKDRPVYIVSDVSLNLGDNLLLPDPQYGNTLYEFVPAEAGVYTFTVSEGVLGDWNTVYNPVDKTENKTAQLEWICTDAGQSVLIGVSQSDEAILTITKTGEYEAEEKVPETEYENTYEFDYQLPENPELIAIDVLDQKRDEAILDKNGFYRYGSKYGPLMVADLSEFPVNLEDAILNGQLRAYVYDGEGNLIARNNYNTAMSEYLEAGLVPVTQELGMMLSQLGNHHDWWKANGFVFGDAAPTDEASAWMTACSYIKGSELEPENEGNSGSNNQGGSSNQGGSNGNPKTSDISMMWAVIAIVMAGTCLVVLKKKETFFLN